MQHKKHLLAMLDGPVGVGGWTACAVTRGALWGLPRCWLGTALSHIVLSVGKEATAKPEPSDRKTDVPAETWR